MSWNGYPVIDLDSHIVERADRFDGNYLDRAYREPSSSRPTRERVLALRQPRLDRGVDRGGTAARAR